MILENVSNVFVSCYICIYMSYYLVHFPTPSQSSSSAYSSSTTIPFLPVVKTTYFTTSINFAAVNLLSLASIPTTL